MHECVGRILVLSNSNNGSASSNQLQFLVISQSCAPLLTWSASHLRGPVAVEQIVRSLTSPPQEKDRKRDINIEKRDRQTETKTDTQTHRHTDTQTHRQRGERGRGREGGKKGESESKHVSDKLRRNAKKQKCRNPRLMPTSTHHFHFRFRVRPINLSLSLFLFLCRCLSFFVSIYVSEFVHSGVLFVCMPHHRSFRYCLRTFLLGCKCSSA